MKLTILGNGGGLNNGLPYNSFLINKTTLVETPPDIMLSLQREKIKYDEINEIFISHLHGDHIFGFPFLALSLYMNDIGKKNNNIIKVYIPMKGEKYIIDLCRKALSAEHPCNRWIKSKFEFIQIDEYSKITLSGFNSALFKTDHFQEAYAFILSMNGRNIFSYIADTKWCANVERIISSSPEYIIIDMNGEPTDNVPVHISEKDLTGYLKKHDEINTKFLGTHLKHQKKSNQKNIEYVYPGMVVEIDE